MVAVDTTQATSSNSVKVYINGVQVTAFGTATYPPQNDDLFFNDSNGGVSYICALRGFLGTFNYDGYLAEFNFIDGQQLTPSSFGQTSTTTGAWIPKKFSGTYGTNGFYLKFTDTTSTSTLGTDFSGNSNTWTVNNISLTAGSTYDSMTDVPTLTSVTTANYCVINPLANSGIGTLSRGNLQLVTSTNAKAITGTMALPSTGQYYWEITATDYITGNGTFFGVVNQEFLTGAPSNGTWLGFNTYNATYDNGTSTDTNGLTGTDVTNDGDIWCIAIDVTNNKFWIGRSRSGTLVWADGVTPAVNGSGASTLSLPTGNLYPMAYRGGSDNETYNFNFGQQPFAHTPPTGFLQLNTFNLPTPTIGATASTQANRYMDATLFTATAGTNTIVNAGGFQPDLVWIKSRNNPQNHYLVDSVRGGTSLLQPNVTNAESIYSTPAWIISFNSNGFTSSTDSLLSTSYTYVGWQWRASNATAVTNTDGTITSTVSANTSAGFSIVTYTGNATSAQTVGHGLGVTPTLFILKSRGVQVWNVYSLAGGATGNTILQLNDPDGLVTGGNIGLTASSTTIGFGSAAQVNGSSVNFVAYVFAPVAGYSAFGSYVGTSTNDGAFIYTGFRPAFVLYKKATGTDGWYIFDTKRNPYNLANASLRADSSAAELVDGPGQISIVSNGFKHENANTIGNSSSFTYIYIAFAETPFKYANARQEYYAF